MKSWYDINVELFCNNVFLIIYFFSCCLFGITMGKWIRRIYKYDQRNCPKSYSNINFVVPPSFDTSIQTQYNSASDSSMVENDVASDGLYQSINHHGNKDVKDNDNSQPFETPRKNNFCYSSFDDTITNTTKPQSSKCLHLENNIYVFKLKGTFFWNEYLKSTHLGNNVLLLRGSCSPKKWKTNGCHWGWPIIE